MSGNLTSATVPGALPLLGHLPRLARDPAGFLAGLPAFGDLVEFRLGTHRVQVPCHPELLRQVYADDRTFDKGGPFYQRFRDILGNGLATCPHRDHRRQRRLLQPEFRADRLPGYAEVMTREAEQLTRGWTDGATIDAFPAFYRYTLRVVARSLLATEVPDALVDRLQESFEHAFAGALRRVLLPPLPAGRRYHAAVAALGATVCELVRDYRERGVDRGDLLSGLLAARDEDGSALTDAEVHDQVLTLLLAGTETSAAQLAWTCRLLLEHPEVAARLQAEIDGVLGGRAATYQDVEHLPYTANVLTESLRRYPPGWILLRTTTRTTELADRTLPPGSYVVLSPYVAHHNPRIFADPTRFDPDRWQPERAAALPRWAFGGFSNGPRQCIGEGYARAETVIALATVLARWELAPAPGTRPAPVRLTTILRPRRLPLRTVRRPLPPTR
ncbi:cytochrome P450 [Kitasatospora sp. GAS1066B]|uniref:cytochrome P450 n=1 Tax=Kitasatospora sp. GAS1066B TaxID=3156271 RepID=UPI003511FA84